MVETFIQWKTAQSLPLFLGRYQAGYKQSLDTLTTKVEIKPYFHNVLFVNNCKFFNAKSGLNSGK